MPFVNPLLTAEGLARQCIFIVLELTEGLLLQVSLTSALEFWCAQSPYNTRGLLLSLLSSAIFVSMAVESAVHSVLITYSHSWCSPVMFSVKTLLCLIGFILYCVVARWYKLRVRDEEYSPQQVIEEVYDRYLTAAAAQPNTYGAVR